jgi:hypothetical protein
MNTPAAARNPIAKRVSLRSRPGHGDAWPDSHPSALSTAPSAPKAIVIAAQASPRHTGARDHLTATLSRLASNANTAIKSP